MHGKDHYSRQDWAYYVLPDCRLILFVVIGQLMSWYDDLLEPLGFKNIWTRATEFKELYWSMAVMFWAIMLYRRILAGAPSFTVSEEISAEKEELVEVYAAED